MDYEKQYESWKKRRAEAEVPDDFADRVMISIRRTRMQFWLMLFKKTGAIAARSKIFKAAIYTLALVIWLTRLVALFAIFIPL
jgi:hypothetical protein